MNDVKKNWENGQTARREERQEERRQERQNIRSRLFMVSNASRGHVGTGARERCLGTLGTHVLITLAIQKNVGT